MFFVCVLRWIKEAHITDLEGMQLKICHCFGDYITYTIATILRRISTRSVYIFGRIYHYASFLNDGKSCHVQLDVSFIKHYTYTDEINIMVTWSFLSVTLENILSGNNFGRRFLSASVPMYNITDSSSDCQTLLISWRRHQMETFPALLAICAGNSPVTGEFSHKGQWRGTLMFYYDVIIMIGRLSSSRKQ